MRSKKCCISGCGCNDQICRLFCFPQNKELHNLWSSIAQQHCQSIAKYRTVCAHHFEEKYFNPVSKRLMYPSIPSLFTREEIESKSPKTPYSFKELVNIDRRTPLKRPLSSTESQGINGVIAVNHDHTYQKKKKFEIVELPCLHVEAVATQVEVVATQVEAVATQVEAAALQTMMDCSTTQEIQQNETNTNTDKNNNQQAQQMAPVQSSNARTRQNNNKNNQPMEPVQSTNRGTCLSVPKSSKRQRIIRKIENLTPNCRKLYTTCSKIMKCKRRIMYSLEDRIKKVRDLCEKNSVISVIDSMSPAAKTFFHMQLNQVNKHAKRRRFTADDKIFGLTLMKQSPKAYRLLRKLFILPSKATLNKFSKNMNISTGLNPQILTALKNLTKDWNINKKLCSIVFDEVALTPQLTFVESEGKIYGFVQFGKERELKICDHALVVMIRGICGSWIQPVAYYFCEGSTPAITLKNILRDVVDAVTQIGLIPKVLICDQGATNRSCLRSLQNDIRRESLINNTAIIDHKIDVGGHKLNIIYDPPHLMKGIRNNLLDKDMIFKGKLAKWSDIVDVYKEDCASGNVRLLHKLTDEHVIPAKIKKMKVKNCTQVFSERTSAMLILIARYGILSDGTPVNSSMKNTAEAVLFFDRLFDSVNGSRNGSAPVKMRGPVKEVHGVNKHLEFWKTSIATLEKIAFVDKRGRHVQVPSIKNWITTLQSLIELWSDLKEVGVKFLYTRHLNQDPLENFFGRIRALNYRNTNPDCYTFQTAFKSLLLCKILSSHSYSFNCEDDNTETLFGTSVSKITNAAEDNIDPDMHIQQHPGAVEATSSLFQQARQERVHAQASAFTAGYVSRKLLKKNKCLRCKDILLTSDITEIHTWISLRERAEQQRSLYYPNSKFIILFRELVIIINTYLNSCPHIQSITQHIRSTILTKSETGWFGCQEHHKEILDYFITLVCRVQIHNWCNSINKILKGSDIHRLLSSGVMSPLQALAFKKYKSLRSRK